MDEITIDDFAKVELRVARVLEVKEHPDADRLYVLKVDGGEERQIVAGIRENYAPNELLGREIIVVWNLKPAKLRGVESHGMLLALKDGKRVSVVGPDASVTPGLRVG